MKTITHNEVVYLNPSSDSLSQMGIPAETVAAVMRLVEESDARTKRDQLLQLAALRIAPLQDAVDIGTATEAEAAMLLSWKQYRVALNRISEQPGYPSEITWPAAPAE